MKKLLLLLAVLFAAFSAKADDWVLQVLLSDGQVVSIKLSEEPRTTYQDGRLVITTNNYSVSYPLESVKRFTYVSTDEVIDAIKAIEATFSNDGETLTFTSLKPHTKIYLYNVAGQLLKTFDSGNRDKIVISASQYPSGVYVVKVNGGTYKISKR